MPQGWQINSTDSQRQLEPIHGKTFDSDWLGTFVIFILNRCSMTLESS